MLKMLMKSVLFMAFGSVFINPSYTMEANVNSIPQEKRTPLANYLAGKRTFIVQEATNKLNFLFDPMPVHTASWNPQMLHQENPLASIKEQVVNSIKAECQNKGIKWESAVPLLTCFLNQYNQAFENFDVTYNKIRQLMIENEASLKGKIANDFVNQAYKDELMKIVGPLHQTLQENLQAITSIQRHTGEALLNMCQK
jgi:hypothetical protein